MSVADHIEKLLLKAEVGKPLSREDMLALLKMPGELATELFAAADRIRKNEVGNEIYLRGLIEFANICERDCLYCGLRKSNETLERYRMTDDEILEAARRVKAAGLCAVELRSGEDSRNSTQDICRLIESIKKETDLVITLSMGERPVEDYRAFGQAGANGYLLRFETAANELYPYLRPGCRLDKRVSCLRTLKELGFETGTGNTVGLPGQTYEMLADDLLLMKLLDADLLEIWPFVPHPDTPLAGIDNDGIEMTLRVIALARIITRNANIAATSRLDVMHPQGRLLALSVGANGVVPDFTPQAYKSRSAREPASAGAETAESMMAALATDLESIGRTISQVAGNRPPRQGATTLH